MVQKTDKVKERALLYLQRCLVNVARPDKWSHNTIVIRSSIVKQNSMLFIHCKYASVLVLRTGQFVRKRHLNSNLHLFVLVIRQWSIDHIHLTPANGHPKDHKDYRVSIHLGFNLFILRAFGILFHQPQTSVSRPWFH